MKADVTITLELGGVKAELTVSRDLPDDFENWNRDARNEYLNDLRHQLADDALDSDAVAVYPAIEVGQTWKLRDGISSHEHTIVIAQVIIDQLSADYSLTENNDKVWNDVIHANFRLKS